MQFQRHERADAGACASEQRDLGERQELRDIDGAIGRQAGKSVLLLHCWFAIGLAVGCRVSCNVLSSGRLI